MLDNLQRTVDAIDYIVATCFVIVHCFVIYFLGVL